MHVDESGVQASICREYARAPRGEKARGEKQGNRKGRINLIGAEHQGGIIAPARFEGSCNADMALKWLSEVLLPLLSPGMWLIMDNASFHKPRRIRDLIESRGCRVAFLPAYSPDLNPIEGHWSGVKARIRSCRHRFERLVDAVDCALQPTVLTSA